jgi:hypothetical protein
MTAIRCPPRREPVPVAAPSARLDLLTVVVCLFFLSPALLFLPGAQPYRSLIRAIPYVSSLGMIFWFVGSRRLGPIPLEFALVGLALGVMLVNLLRPESHTGAGLAQCVFQLSIAAPVFWAGNLVTTQKQLGRLLGLIFLISAASVLTGLLQVYDPQTFMPKFTSLGLAVNPHLVSSLTYLGANGQRIIRPPGLSDVPGGAAAAGATTAILGCLLGAQQGQGATKRLLCFSVAGLGALILFLTQVRSLLLMTVLAIAMMCFLLFRWKRLVQGGLLAAAAGVLVVLAFSLAVGIGGNSVARRFLGLAENGLIASYQQNRGMFLEYTLDQLLSTYPLGAGVGRWGVTQLGFGDDSVSPLYAEIQITGWLYDGGLPLILLYGGAVLAALTFAYGVAVDKASLSLGYYAGMIFCLDILVAGQAMAGPTFNTQLGLQFWLLAGALRQTADSGRSRGATRRL